MAKKRKAVSIFDADVSKDTVTKTIKPMEEKAIEPIPDKKEKTKPSTEAGEGAKKHLYVSPTHHRKAKISALMNNMKLGEYIEWLIDQNSK